MPTDLLLPAFVLTLLANAVLVAVAVRGLLHARSERDRQDASNLQRNADRAAAGPAPGAAPPVVEAPPPPTVPPAPDPVPEPDSSPETRPAKPRRRTGAATDVPLSKDAAPKPTQPAKRKRPSAGDRPRSEARRGSRRRFSLPPLDDDHERVNRSIETFFAGGDNGEAGDPAASQPTVATTVALVAIDGLQPQPSVADRRAVDGVLVSLERTLRGAARASDQVTADGVGRFRVVLPATGELAARAYLRRVRATVGPSLESIDGPLGLVTATATVLDDTVHVAVAQAEARLDAALASVAQRASDDEPRIAAD
jgi:GGDEF domain-containing protein